MWRYTMVWPKLVVIDARALLPLLLMVFHWRMWTLKLALGSCVVFFGLSYFSITPIVALRRLRRLFIGVRRPSRFNGVRRLYWRARV